MHAYYKRLISDDIATRLQAAKAWSLWEAVTSTLRASPEMQLSMSKDDFALAFARIEAHYFVNKGFFARETQLIDDAHRIRHIPGVIVQGRYDLVCPPITAWRLHEAWPDSELVMLPVAGHAVGERGVLAALTAATDRFRPAPY